MPVLFTYPTNEEWLEIAEDYPHAQMEITDIFFEVESFNASKDPLSKFINNQEAEAWARHLVNRLGDVYISYVMLMFYFNKGIPDDTWWISPGKSGHGVDYFPNFQEHHHFTHKQFSYYSDTFFFKISSSWDTLGQFLNCRFNLEFEKQDVSFIRIVNALEKSNPKLHANLVAITDSTDYKELSALRNSVTHRFSPNSVDAGIILRKTEKSQSVDITVGNYSTSKEIKNSVDKALVLMGQTLQPIRQALSKSK